MERLLRISKSISVDVRSSVRRRIGLPNAKRYEKLRAQSKSGLMNVRHSLDNVCDCSSVNVVSKEVGYESCSEMILMRMLFLYKRYFEHFTYDLDFFSLL